MRDPSVYVVFWAPFLRIHELKRKRYPEGRSTQIGFPKVRGPDFGPPTARITAVFEKGTQVPKLNAKYVPQTTITILSTEAPDTLGLETLGFGLPSPNYIEAQGRHVWAIAVS